MATSPLFIQRSHSRMVKKASLLANLWPNASFASNRLSGFSAEEGVGRCMYKTAFDAGKRVHTGTHFMNRTLSKWHSMVSRAVCGLALVGIAYCPCQARNKDSNFNSNLLNSGHTLLHCCDCSFSSYASGAFLLHISVRNFLSISPLSGPFQSNVFTKTIRSLVVKRATTESEWQIFWKSI